MEVFSHFLVESMTSVLLSINLNMLVNAHVLISFIHDCME